MTTRYRTEARDRLLLKLAERFTEILALGTDDPSPHQTAHMEAIGDELVAAVLGEPDG